MNCGSIIKLEYLLLMLIVGLSGCVITVEDRHKRSSYIADIEEDSRVFVSDCQFTYGYLYVPRRRVQNAPPTPWEMQDAVCFYDDMYPYRFAH